MKGYLSMFALVFLWCAVMPAIINAKNGQAYYESTPAFTETADTEETSADKKPIYIRVYNAETDKREEYELEEYTALALSAIMDEGSEAEALKAQAVAIRSVICYRHENPCHEGFEICTDKEHCFALSETAREECLEAVDETEGIILTYNGKAAFAVSHLSSCVSTESGAVVYGEELPYLMPVSVLDESGFAYYKTQKHLSAEEYQNAFSSYNTSFTAENMLGEICFTEGNRVYTIEAGGLCFKGSTFARLFGLPSTCFTVSKTDNGVTLTCYGNGNGAGMSRLSAVLMAKNGKSYKEILAHFYTGTLLSHICTE